MKLRVKPVVQGLAVAFGGLMIVSANAQQQPQVQEEVVVTGTRIRMIDAESTQPVSKITQEDIQRSGLVTVGDIVNQLNSAGTPDFSKGQALTSNPEQGGQYINLRNLQSNRLLVLVDGKRWTQTLDGFTDVSTIPSSMIERIEVLRDGASTIYGSDAIAGVVNFIMKKNMSGAFASAYYGENQKGDGTSQDYSFSFGAGGDKASMMFGLNYSKQDEVWAKDREVTAYSYGPTRPTSALGTGPWGRIRQVSSSGGATGFDRVLNHTGTYDGVGVGEDSRNPNNFHTRSSSNVNDLFNSTQQMMFQMPSELASGFLRGSLDLPLAMTLSATAMYSERTSTRQIAGYPLNSTSQPNYPVFVSKDSYYNPYGNQVAGAGKGQDLFFYRRTIEVPRTTTNENNALHFDVALQGELSFGGSKPWNWSIAYNYNDSSGTESSTGNLNLPNLKSALGPSFMDSSGVVRCGTPGAVVGGCVPFNLIGGPSASTPEALNYVMAAGSSTYGNTTKSWLADITGTLFNLPAGPLGMAAGLEYRDQSGYDKPGQFERSGLSTDLAGNPTVGSYTVKEGYVEFQIPVLKGVTMADTLSFNISGRYSDYSTYGNTTNGKYSMLWRPYKDLMVRGTYADGFRAPTIGDTAGGGSQSFDSYLDPCDSANGAAAKDPAIKARCNAAGVPTNFRQLNQAGNPVSAGGGQTPYPFNAGAGNSDLQPETATTQTLGLIFSPAQVSGLTLAFDWYKIEIEDVITGISAGYVLNQCYVSGNSAFCDDFKRDSTGQVVTLNRGNANLGGIKTAGYDFGVYYRFPTTKWGNFNVRWDNTYVDYFKQQATAGGEWTDYAGYYDGYAYYKWRSNLNLDWSMGSWSVTWGMRYYDSIKGQCWSSDPVEDCTNPGEESPIWGPDVNRIGSMTYHDVSVGYKFPWKGQILAGINNVFAKDPTVNISSNYTLNGPSSSSSVDPNLPIDRFFWIRYNQYF